jgi:hypothetical protein
MYTSTPPYVFRETSPYIYIYIEREREREREERRKMAARLEHNPRRRGDAG